MSYTQTGTIKIIEDTKSFGSNGFTKRNLVIITDEKYPQTILFEFIKDKCTLLDQYIEGEQVKVSFNLQGREWTNSQGQVSYFNSFQVWRIEKLEEEKPLSEQYIDQQEKAAKTVPDDSEFEQEDDIPF